MSDSTSAEPQLIDLMHLGRAKVIGAWRVGEVIVDPGPSSCLSELLAAFGRDPPRALALTHIHLDHAGATGSLVRRFPELEVWVHERGATHVSDPSKLLASAQRLYGKDMQRLWGEVLPVPADRLRVLGGGEVMGEFEVAYTPGHASHHVSYLHLPTRRAFTGDVTGVRIGAGRVMAPTPPPDIDVDAWFDSIRRIQRWEPAALVLTHFGRIDDVDGHLKAVRHALWFQAELARESDAAEFVRRMESHTDAEIDRETAQRLFDAGDPADFYAGLTRYLQMAPTS
jgi:glyoxylase-like metal-dependent hydrolase (beta-lactamase superfamily II)